MPGLVNITVPYDKIPQLREAFPRHIDAAVRSALRRIERVVREMTPTRQRAWEPGAGALRRTFYASTFQDRILLHWPQPYAEYVDKGTLAHKVAPKDPSEKLVWMPFPGIVMTSRGHMVSGISGRHFVKQALEVALEILMEELEYSLALLSMEGGS